MKVSFLSICPSDYLPSVDLFVAVYRLCDVRSAQPGSLEAGLVRARAWPRAFSVISFLTASGNTFVCPSDGEQLCSNLDGAASRQPVDEGGRVEGMPEA